MSLRKIFTDAEKLCLQELIIKYKLNTAPTTRWTNIAAKRMAWARLVEEYNAIQTVKRTEAQLRKCWDNLKTRKKALLVVEKREPMRTGDVSYCKPSEDDGSILIDDDLAEHTDVKINVIDSDNITQQDIFVPEGNLTRDDERLRNITQEHTNNANAEQVDKGSKYIRTKVSNDEFNIKKIEYKRSQERDAELHKLIIAEKQWLVKAAEEKFKTAVLETQRAKELLRYNIAKREAAEIMKYKLV